MRTSVEAFVWWISLAVGGVPSIDAPLRTGATTPGAAVIVGIEDYAFLPDVPFANRDADTMANVITYTMGIAPERVTHLRTANREQLLSAMQNAQAAAAGGPVYVYFAGHGATAPDGALMLVGDDAKAEAAVFTARSVRVPDLLLAAGPRAKLFLDTCYAGVGRGGDPLIPGARLALPVYVMPPAAEQTVWTAAAPTEVSLPYQPAKHGLFTYFLAGGMRGWADGELDGAPDGSVTEEEAWAFVQRALKGVEATQSPQRQGASGGVLSTGRLEAAPPLDTLPRVGGAIQLGPPEPTQKPVTGKNAALVPPFVLRGSTIRDSMGRVATHDELASVGLGNEVARVKRSGQTGLMLGIGGVAIAAVSTAVGVALAGSRSSALTSYQQTKDGCDAGTIAENLCTGLTKPGGAAGVLIPAIGIAAGGLTLAGIGIVQAKSARQKLVEHANDTLR